MKVIALSMGEIPNGFPTNILIYLVYTLMEKKNKFLAFS